MKNSVSVFVSGDFVPLHKAGVNLAAGKPEEVFGTVLPIIKSCDLAITNLETALTAGGAEISKCGPCLKVDPAVLPATLKAGFSLFTVANNHTRDWGNEAFLETLQHITDSGASYVGGGKNLEEAAVPFRTVINGLRLTVFNAGMQTPCSARHRRPGANPLSPAKLTAQIANERDKSDFILVIIHDGKEHLPCPSPRIRENYRAFIDAGANAVIGHHPHIAQGYEMYHGGFIAYSLGNFVFPPRNPENVREFWHLGYSVKLDFGTDREVTFEILPHENSKETHGTNLMTGEEKEKFLDNIAELNRLLADDEACDEFYCRKALQFFPNYQKRLLSNPDDYVRWACVMATDEHVDVLKESAWKLAFDE